MDNARALKSPLLLRPSWPLFLAFRRPRLTRNKASYGLGVLAAGSESHKSHFGENARLNLNKDDFKQRVSPAKIDTILLASRASMWVVAWTRKRRRRRPDSAPSLSNAPLRKEGIDQRFEEKPARSFIPTQSFKAFKLRLPSPSSIQPFHAAFEFRFRGCYEYARAVQLYFFRCSERSALAHRPLRSPLSAHA